MDPFEFASITLCVQKIKFLNWTQINFSLVSNPYLLTLDVRGPS